MQQLTQKEAVFKAVQARKKPDGSYERKDVVDELFKMFRAGEFAHGDPDKVRDDKALRDYCGSILSNWLRKDPRLGGAEADPNRATRKKTKPADDEMVRLMRAKVVLTTEGQPTTEIDALITARSQQIIDEKEQTRRDVAADAEALLASLSNPK
jgi:hypothetical protein